MDKLKSKLVSETAKIKWHELQRFFARGNVLVVSSAGDLVEVAAGFAADDAEAVAKLMKIGVVSSVSDAQARTWIEQDAIVWSVVVAPFVLVQACDTKAEDLSS